MRIVALVTALLLALFVGYAAQDLPPRGDPDSPADVHVSPHYIERAVEETETPNIVNAVLADYRSFDTFGEALVVFVAALACIVILVGRTGYGPNRLSDGQAPFHEAAQAEAAEPGRDPGDPRTGRGGPEEGPV